MAEQQAGNGTPQRGGFTVTVHENKFLSAETTEVVAVLTVTANQVGLAPGANGGGDSAGPAAAEVILLDCSGSMADPPTKLSTAKQATCAAIDALRDGVLFAVVRGDHEAELAYPERPVLVPATAETRAAARAAVRRLAASGGTAMGRWLRLAGSLLAEHRSAVRHAMLITDGKQEHESRAELDQVLAACAGQFGCDARGIGDSWDPTELRHITSVLNGHTRGVARFDEMVADFEDLMLATMRRAVPDVDLKVRTVKAAWLREIRQVYPAFLDLTPQRMQLDDFTASFPTGSWADETREYQLCVQVRAKDQPAGEDLLAARVDVVVRDDTFGAGRPRSAPALILVHWTDDPVLSTRMDPQVAHYAGQEELGDAVRAGCDAYHSGDRPAAVAELGRAVKLASESGNTDILHRLKRLVDVLDESAGVVRLRDDVSVSELLATEASSVFTSRSDKHPGATTARSADGPPRECPEPGCGYRSAPDAKFCQQCGHEFAAGAGAEPS